MKRPKSKITDGKVETAMPVHHLIHATSNGKPLCGESSPAALIGSYVEHLDDAASAQTRWVREVFGADGKPVASCAICVSLYPPVLLDIVPFNLNIKLLFKPNLKSAGYDVVSEAFAEVSGKRSQINAFPVLGYFSAKWIGNLDFSIDVDANPAVPLVEHANKTKQ